LIKPRQKLTKMTLLVGQKTDKKKIFEINKQSGIKTSCYKLLEID